MKLIKGFWYEIPPHENCYEVAVVRTNRTPNSVSGAGYELIQRFDNEEDAKEWLDNQVGFIKEITSPDQDGFSLLYEGLNCQVIVSISKDAVETLEIHSENVAELLGQINFEPLIESLFPDANLDKIDIDSDGVKIKGKLIYNIDKLKEIVKR
ncbi:MAG: hypothetical protein PHG95_03080 [Patescibacteria group bacterium]|nr:hypothetical protein [Patescibacteria group bacterium]